MTLQLQIVVTEREQPLCRVNVPARLILGRQRNDREELYTLQPGAVPRLAVAPLQEDTVSREQVDLEWFGHNQLRVVNVSQSVTLRLPDGSKLATGNRCELDLPCTLGLGRLTVRVQFAPSEVTTSGLLSLPGMARDSSLGPRRSPAELSLSLGRDSTRVEELFGWLQAAIDVLHSAASSSDFFRRAAQGIVDIAGLDRGRVLLLQNDVWVEAARHATDAAETATWEPSHQVLAQVRTQRRTFWQDPHVALLDSSSSLRGVVVIVASPILSADNQVIGALYGDCRQDPINPNASTLSRLAAMLVELLARGVGLGLARMEQEKVALSARVQFEQFFTPDLARHLQTNPALLEGRDCTVSVLFCDIRDFSRLSERLGPQKTVAWIRNALSVLSDCVLKYNGVLVDYIGDALMAMWGAPGEQADHANRACQAALDMLAALPELTARWHELLEEPFGLGIGINTGPAHVGNIGSTAKFKYGPLGNTVNLGSRVQGVTKYLQCPLLITDSTRRELTGNWASRRLCQVRVVNIQEPVTLHELSLLDRPHWELLRTTYEDALVQFEQHQFRQSARALANLLGEVGTDGPALVLMSRAVNALVDGPTENHPLWNLPGK